eukprot:15196931-Heterocapsa_arctica.AAC.1
MQPSKRTRCNRAAGPDTVFQQIIRTEYSADHFAATNAQRTRRPPAIAAPTTLMCSSPDVEDEAAVLDLREAA